jgi:hypothetical protein
VNLEQRPEVVRGLMAAAALLFVIAIIGAFTVDSDDTKLASNAGSTTTTVTGETVPGVTPTVATTAVASATTAARGKAPVTTAVTTGPPPTAARAVPDPGATKPPAAGSYEYKLTDSTGKTSTMTEKIEVKPDQAGAARRLDTYTDADGNTLTNDTAWAPDSVKVLTSHIVSTQATIDCTWNPPILVAALPLAEGKTWTSDSTCKTTVQGAQITIHRVEQMKVTGKALDQVAGTSVAVWIIEGTSTTDVSSPFGTQHAVQNVVRHFAPPRGLLTYEKTNGQSATSGQSLSSERTLQNLAPK